MKTTKRLFMVLCCILASAITLTTQAATIASGTCGKNGDNLTWTLSDDGTLTITGNGEMQDYFSTSTPWYSYREEIKKITIYNDVTSIGNCAFSSCSSLTSVIIPNSVTKIGTSVFYNCNNLSVVAMSFEDEADFSNYLQRASGTATNTVFYCSELRYIAHAILIAGEVVKDVVIPNSVKSIGNYTFKNCTGLTSVTIPTSVTNIGNYAFEDCRSLPSVNIPNSVTSLGDNAFTTCIKLRTITIPSSVASIGNNAFWNCSALETVVMSFQDEADFSNYLQRTSATSTIFYSSGLLNLAHEISIAGEIVKDVVIPNSVKSIGNYTFKNCTELTTVTIPTSVTTIGSNAFSQCM